MMTVKRNEIALEHLRIIWLTSDGKPAVFLVLTILGILFDVLWQHHVGTATFF